MISRAAAVALYLALVGGYLAFGRADPDRLDLAHVSRIGITIETTVAGKPVTREWAIPALRLWEIPEYWLIGGTRTVRTMRSPFDTVFMPLPTGQALGVDLRDVSFNMSWWWQPVVEPPEFRRSLFYLLDSIDRPTTLTDYAMPAQGGNGCPKDAPIAGCKVVSSITPLKVGPVVPSGIGGSDLLAGRNGWKKFDELRRFGLEPPKPMVFVGLHAVIQQSSALHSNPELQAGFRAFARPTSRTAAFPAAR